MKITPKPPEVLEAQVAAYTAENLDHRSDRTHVLSNVGAIVGSSPIDIVRVTEEGEYHVSTNSKIPEGTYRVAAEPVGYLRYLRSIGGRNHDTVRVRREILGNYERFSDQILGLKSDIDRHEDPWSHPSFIGHGGSADVFRIDLDGHGYAVRLPRGNKPDPGIINKHISAAVLSKGIPHLEQLVAASYEDGVTVAEIMPGKILAVGMTAEDISHMNKAQLEQLAETLLLSRELGLIIDPKPSNFFYEQEEGFGIVDLSSARDAGQTPLVHTVAESLSDGARALANAGLYKARGRSRESAEEYALEAGIHEGIIDVLKVYREVIMGYDMPESERDQVLEVIDGRIEESTGSLNNYLNPEWVEQELSRSAEARRRRLAVEADKAKLGSDYAPVEEDFV